MLWRAWYSRTCYDLTKHGGAKKLLAAA